MKTSPLPWKAVVGHISDANGRTVCSTYDVESSRAEEIDRAQLITRAVNCHAELVAALEKAKETIFAFHGEIAWSEYQHSPEMKIINAALAKAKGAK